MANIVKLKFLKMKAECSEVLAALRGFQEFHGLEKVSKPEQDTETSCGQSCSHGICF